jgi:hypothetical protein
VLVHVCVRAFEKPQLQSCASVYAGA